jgi:hypothetical protein
MYVYICVYICTLYVYLNKRMCIYTALTTAVAAYEIKEQDAANVAICVYICIYECEMYLHIYTNMYIYIYIYISAVAAYEIKEQDAAKVAVFMCVYL